MYPTAVLVSGGVDSSVALMRLAADGRRPLTAFYLKIWLEDELAFLGDCPWEDDLRVVREVCAMADVPLEVVPLQREYLDLIVEPTLDALRRGLTPSPDVFCNRRVKFGAFVNAIGNRFERIATGHYARTRHEADTTRLLRAVDRVKDQTYFLSHMTQQQVARSVFPIGHSTKNEVRAEARRLDLPNRDRPDSQGLCFLGKIPYDRFVRFHHGDRPGDIRDRDSGRILGEHRGTWYYTVGQRRGLGLAGGPWYVCGTDVATATVWVTHGDRLAEHARSEVRVAEAHWIANPPQAHRLEIRVRHGQQPVGCRTDLVGRGFVATMDHADPGVAPGQIAVLSCGDEVLGGGVIVG